MNLVALLASRGYIETVSSTEQHRGFPPPQKAEVDGGAEQGCVSGREATYQP